MRKTHGSYTRKDGPERAAAYRLRDQHTPVAEIARLLGRSEPTVWRWLRTRPPAGAPVMQARRLLTEALAQLGKIEA